MKKDNKFKPGCKPGPGRPKGKDLTVALKMTRHKISNTLIETLQMDIQELEASLLDKARTVMDHVVGRICLMAIKHGDHQRLNFIFDRIVGKVTEKVEYSLPKPTIIEFSTGQQIQLGSKLELEEGETDE